MGVCAWPVVGEGGGMAWHGPHTGISAEACYIYTSTGYIYLPATTGVQDDLEFASPDRRRLSMSFSSRSISSEPFAAPNRPSGNQINQ